MAAETSCSCRGPRNRVDDGLIARAAAHVPGDRLGDLLARRRRVAVEQRARRHQHPGRAVAALDGEALVEDQQLDRAIPVLEHAVKAPDALPHAPASLGRAYVQAGRYEEALPFLQAASATDEDGDVHYQLARAYQALQRPAEAAKAMAVYQQKKQEAPPSPDAAPEPVLTPPE